MRDVRCPLCPRYLVYPDALTRRDGYLGAPEVQALCPCGVTAWVNPTKAFVVSFNSATPLRVRRA